MVYYRRSPVPPKILLVPDKLEIDGRWDRKNENNKKREYNSTNRMLRVCLNPSWDMQQAIHFRHLRIKKRANLVIHSRLSCKEVSMAYHKVLLPIITYSLPVTIFTNNDTQDMQTLADEACKIQMKLNQKFHNTVYRGIPRCGGLWVVPITTHQVYTWIQHLIDII